MKEKINISKHALMRFASKVHNKQIISDKSFEEWKKLRLTDTDNIICPIGNYKKSDIGNESK